jgi:glyoxylate reductase
MSLPALYVSRLLPDPVMAAIHERFRLINAPEDALPTEAQLREGLSAADAAICTLTESITELTLGHATSLKVLANYAVGYNNIDLQAAARKQIVVTNTPDVLTDATADLTWGLILAVARRLVEGDALARSGNWRGLTPTQLLGLDISGRVLGVIGMGRIGRAVAERARGFRMRILYSSRQPPKPGASHEGWTYRTIEQLLKESDIVSLHVPLTAATTHLIGSEQLGLMKPSSILINVSRGPVIDEAALVEALQQGRLAGAGLDVYEHEPRLNPGLVSLGQVVLLPHLGSATLATRVRMGMICLDNIDAVLNGRPAPNRVADETSFVKREA